MLNTSIKSRKIVRIIYINAVFTGQCSYSAGKRVTPKLATFSLLLKHLPSSSYDNSYCRSIALLALPSVVHPQLRISVRLDVAWRPVAKPVGKIPMPID